MRFPGRSLLEKTGKVPATLKMGNVPATLRSDKTGNAGNVPASFRSSCQAISAWHELPSLVSFKRPLTGHELPISTRNAKLAQIGSFGWNGVCGMETQLLPQEPIVA